MTEMGRAGDDEGLVMRMAAGDEAALAALYDAHAGTLYSLVLALLGVAEEAEEVVADAFLQAWRSPARFDPSRGSVAAWLVTIARTRALDRLRASRRRARAVVGREGVLLPEGPAAAVQPALHDVDRRSQVMRCLEELPDPQRRVIELAYFGGRTQSEIARELGEPLGTVKTRMRTAMARLRISLAPLREEGAL